MDFLEYSDISAEVKGFLTSGKLKMTDQAIIFKNSKTGKVEQIQSNDFDAVHFQNIAGNWCLRVFLKNGTLHRFMGFKDLDREKIAKFFSINYNIETLEKELCLKGWNWGTAKFNGTALSFDVSNRTAFEIPLNHVSQCTNGKNEITMEFHQNDDAPVSLMEMRFFIPSNEMAGDVDPVEAFQKQVMKKASVISVSGDAIAIFREIQCLTPRGRYDIKIFQTFFQLHGKTFDYKIPISTVLRLFELPHKDGRQMFFVVSLDPPIKQGQTRYHFLVLLFGPDEESSIELPFSEEELKDKYEGKLSKELSGPTGTVLGKIMTAIINRKLTKPGTFSGHTHTPAISCSFKAAAGYLYPLERGFMYVHKPPIHIRFEEIQSVNFARGGGSTRSFDFEIELRSGTVHAFSSIEKEEYNKLFDFINSKKLNIKNRGKNAKGTAFDEFGDSDTENAPDAYLERVKAEAQERDEDDEDDNPSGEESTDEDFNPNQEESDVAEEYDSDHKTTSSSDDEDGKDSKKRPEKSSKEKKKSKSSSSGGTSSKKEHDKSDAKKKKKRKKDKDSNKPKRPATAFMLWLNESRERIKNDNPGIKVTEIAKKAGEMWKEIKDKSEWEKKAEKAKEAYKKAMKEYIESGGGGGETNKETDTKPKPKAIQKKTTSSSTSPGASGSSAAKAGGFKSKEYIDSDGSSSDDNNDKEKPSVKKKKPGPKSKTEVNTADVKSKDIMKSKTSKRSDSDGGSSDGNKGEITVKKKPGPKSKTEVATDVKKRDMVKSKIPKKSESEGSDDASYNSSEDSHSDDDKKSKSKRKKAPKGTKGKKPKKASSEEEDTDTPSTDEFESDNDESD